jgi:hypothetical protein
LDLVCLDGGVLVIVEVRQRIRGDFGGALASVNRSKQRKIIRATRFFWQRTPSWRALACASTSSACKDCPTAPTKSTGSKTPSAPSDPLLTYSAT